MANLLTYDEIMRFSLIAVLVLAAFSTGAGTTWYIIKGVIPDLRDRIKTLEKQLFEMIEDSRNG